MPWFHPNELPRPVLACNAMICRILRQQHLLMAGIKSFDFSLRPTPAYTYVVQYRTASVISPIAATVCLLALCALSLAFAQTSPAVSPASETTGQAQQCTRYLDEKLAVWRQRLKLGDWQISVVFTRRADLKPRTLGGIRWDKKKKSAVISVVHPSEYRTPVHEMLDDMEFTIVHELVHLQLASLPRSEASRSSEEHAVNRIAEALLGLDRRR